MGDRFDELLLRRAVVLGKAEVIDELFRVPARREACHCDEASFLRRQLATLPDLAEQDVVGESDEPWGEVAEHPLGAGWLSGFGVVCHVVSSLEGGCVVNGNGPHLHGDAWAFAG